MATGTVTRNSQGISNRACGKITGDATITSVTLGFKPMFVSIFNETDAILWEKFNDQADANCVKVVTAGTMTKDTSGAITLTATGFILSAALAAAAKALVWYAD